MTEQRRKTDDELWRDSWLRALDRVLTNGIPTQFEHYHSAFAGDMWMESHLSLVFDERIAKLIADDDRWPGLKTKAQQTWHLTNEQITLPWGVE